MASSSHKRKSVRQKRQRTGLNRTSATLISDNPAHLARPLPQEPLCSISAAVCVSLGSDASTFAVGDTPLKEGPSFVK
jgi:hypothetical protein